MPWVIKKNGPPSKPYCVYKEGTDGKAEGETLGCHPTEAEAKKQQAALYVHVPEAGRAAAVTDPMKEWMDEWAVYARKTR